MTEPLHVLIYGTAGAGICDFYRQGIFIEPLRELGVELRPLTTHRWAAPIAYQDRPQDALVEGNFTLDRSEIDWADVIVFHRFYQTAWNCRTCTLADDEDVMRAHAEATGHEILDPDLFLRPLFDTLERNPRALRGRAIVYETDDDLFHIQHWNGLWRRIAPELDLVRQIVRRADLVTVSTPVLGRAMAPYTDVVRVVRNAIDPDWYAEPVTGPEPAGDPRVLYYGGAVRIRDYRVCQAAVDAAKLAHPALQRVWLGAIDGPASQGKPDQVIAAVDEVLPFVAGVPAFAAALKNARPHVGLAPVVGDIFDRAKSELHWLEYAMAGAATVASRTMEGGPYDVIRDGVDGLLARGKREWHEQLLRAAASRTLREELAGRARERVLADYDVRVRAREWADAYRWAAEHAGRGSIPRSLRVDEAAVAAIRSEASAGIAFRARRRVAAAEGPGRLAALRGGGDACWSPQDANDPLVSVLIPVLDDPLALVERAVASALAQERVRLEVVVAAADPVSLRGRAVLADPRVRIVPIPIGAGDPPPAEPQAARSRQLAHALMAGSEAAAGAWHAPLGPEGQLLPTALRSLLDVAIEHRLEFVYGQALIELPGVRPMFLGTWPPNPDTCLTLGTELYSARLLAAFDYDPEGWREGEAAGWSFWRVLAEANVRMANIEEIVDLLVANEPTAAAAVAA